jgi:hypothetical protein
MHICFSPIQFSNKNRFLANVWDDAQCGGKRDVTRVTSIEVDMAATTVERR